MSDSRLHPKYLWWRAFGLSAILPLLTLSPFFFHTSAHAEIGPYSKKYLIMLLGASIAVALFAAVFAFFSKRRGSLIPAWKCALISAGTLLALIAIEIALRFTAWNDPFLEYRNWGHKKSLLLAYEPAPNSSWSMVGANYNTDEFGFRKNVAHPDWKRSERQRIFTLGGSSVFGYGLNDNQAWPELLQARLKNFAVINAGANGYNSLQSLLRYYLRVLPHKPASLIFYQAMNDVRFEQSDWDSLLIDEPILFSESLPVYLKNSSNGQGFYTQTILGQKLYKLSGEFILSFSMAERARELSKRREFPELELVKSSNRNRYISHVDSLAILLKHNNTRLVLMTFLYNPQGLDPRADFLLADLNQALRDYASDNQIDLIDAARLFENVENKKEYFFADAYHPNQKGAEYLANICLNSGMF